MGTFDFRILMRSAQIHLQCICLGHKSTVLCLYSLKGGESRVTFLAKFWPIFLAFFLTLRFLKHFKPCLIFLPDPRGDGLHEAFQISSVRTSVRTYVRPSVSTLDFSFILHAQFTSDPQYFYRFRTSYVLTIRGADPKFPRPP